MILLVLATATRWGLAEAIFTSLLCMLGFNFYFLPPIGTFTIAEPQNWVALGAFLISAFVASQLSAKAKTRTEEASARRSEIERLYRLSRAMLLDDSTDIVEVLSNIAEFYAHESCGQCTPCREGSLWMAKALHRLTHGEGRKGDADYLLKIADNIPGGRTICAFGEACSWPVQSFVGKFKDEFIAKGAADEERRAKSGAGPTAEMRIAASPQ